jgi:hypothetical protein
VLIVVFGALIWWLLVTRQPVLRLARWPALAAQRATAPRTS